MSTQKEYQEIYENYSWYGNAEQGRSPGVRLIPKYKEWIISPVMDLGCGRGHTVERLRGMGFDAFGMDQIKIHPDMYVGDICSPIKDLSQYSSVICIDCIEHLLDNRLEGLFSNMSKVKQQVFSIHNGEAKATGVDLHINKKPFEVWEKIIIEKFVIVEKIQISDVHVLYLTKQKL